MADFEVASQQCVFGAIIIQYIYIMRGTYAIEYIF